MVFKCQADSFLKEVTLIFIVTVSVLILITVSFRFVLIQFDSKVIICEPTSLNQKNSNGKDETLNGFNVVLEDTILFPEGGGQVIHILTLSV